MRSAEDVIRFRARCAEEIESEAQADFYVECYQSGVPRTFWDVRGDNFTAQHSALKKVQRYCARRRRVLSNGYSLLLMGDNGVGKTMLLSYVLTQMIRRGSTVYYTTLAQLDADIKRGFNDVEAERRLEFLLESDFLAVDEIGKEHFKTESYLNTRLEALLKRRYDDGDPCLLATNLDFGALCRSYGRSLQSMWEGKYQCLILETGDFRAAAKAKMSKDLGA